MLTLDDMNTPIKADRIMTRHRSRMALFVLSAIEVAIMASGLC